MYAAGNSRIYPIDKLYLLLGESEKVWVSERERENYWVQKAAIYLIFFSLYSSFFFRRDLTLNYPRIGNFCAQKVHWHVFLLRVSQRTICEKFAQ